MYDNRFEEFHVDGNVPILLYMVILKVGGVESNGSLQWLGQVLLQYD